MNVPVPQIECAPRAPCIADGEVRMAVASSGPGWLVVDKPCGMSIHNDPGKDLCSLALAAVQAGALPGVGSDIRAMHAAHRIDRDTSGLVLLAGNPEKLAFFGMQFAARTVGKRYLAVVHGSIEGPLQGSGAGDWNWPLADAAAGRNDPAGKGKRMPCITRWRVLAHSRHYSLVECEPLTGRKHQIRRHAKLSGHPVVGDRRYGSGRALTWLRRHRDFHRLGLHAHSLTICLPGETTPRTFSSGGLPQALRQLLELDL
jgi:23S rRNA-/tRNA-specific pseudouridylate synthase